MPKKTQEISSGSQFSRSSNEGQLADSQTRSFRIVLIEPGEFLDFQRECGVSIGDQHPANANLYCVSFDARFEGDSRMVVAVTFNYQSTASQANSSHNQDPKQQPPDVRPCDWTTSTSLVEAPRATWARRNTVRTWAPEEPAVNPAGDMYDGVTALTPITTISVTQFQNTDPTTHIKYTGSVNEDTVTLGNLQMEPGTVLFQGLSSQPVVESWGGGLFRGWTTTFEFAYKQNKTKVIIGGVEQDVEIGWDIALPVTGFNVRAFDPDLAVGDEDVFAQPLKHGDKDDPQFSGRIINPSELPDGVFPFDRVRAMVKVFSYDGGGASQLPSAQPVPLKLNGRPLQTHDANGNLVNRPLVFAYRVQPAINFANTFQIRNP